MPPVLLIACLDLLLLACQLDRERSAQVLFESFGAAGLAVAEQPLLCLYAVGRLSGCCIDIGHGKIGRCTQALVISSSGHPYIACFSEVLSLHALVRMPVCV